MGRATIFKQYNMPTSPMRSDHGEEILMSLLNPLLSDEQHYLTTPNIDRSVEDTLSTIPCNGHAYLLPNAAIATIEGRSLANDRLVQHQNHGSLPLSQPALEPPFAWRHPSGRSDRWCLGRFHRIRNRSM